MQKCLPIVIVLNTVRCFCYQGQSLISNCWSGAGLWLSFSIDLRDTQDWNVSIRSVLLWDHCFRLFLFSIHLISLISPTPLRSITGCLALTHMVGLNEKRKIKDRLCCYMKSTVQYSTSVRKLGIWSTRVSHVTEPQEQQTEIQGSEKKVKVCVRIIKSWSVRPKYTFLKSKK